MGYKSILLAYTLLLCIQSTSAQVWTVQEQVPLISHVWDIEHIVADIYIVISDDGQILRTTDGGLSWIYVVSPVVEDLRRVRFVNISTGWIVGAGGTILKTTDGGQTWHKQLVNSETTFRGVDFLNEDTGWVVGWDGILAHTTDGGTTWTVADTLFNGSDLLDIEFFDDQHGWIVGGFDRGLIAATDDGGESWILQYNSAIVNYLTTVETINDHSAIAAGKHGIFKTVDGGSYWFSVLGLGDFGGAFRDMEMLSPALGYACGDFGQIYRTDDYGSSWEEVELDINQPGINLEGLAFANEQHGIIGGSGGFLARTTNGGENWENASTNPPFYTSIDFFDHSRGWCVNNNNQIFITFNGGTNWDPITIVDGSTVTKLRVQNSTELWMTGHEGKLFHSTNEGLEWMTIQLPTQSILRDIEIRGEHLWVCGDNGKIFYSEDNGESWIDRSNSAEWGWLNAIDFAGDLNGAACGSGGIVVLTNDGGQTWNSSYVPSHFALHDIDFPSEQVGYAVGIGGLIAKTTNGGSTWDEITHPSGARLNAAEFLNDNTGWIFGEGGLVLHTLDGGETWIEQDFPDHLDIRDFSLLAPFGWAVTWSGIFHYTFAETADDARVELPNTISLSAYPNPFNPATTISFTLASPGKVALDLYNIEGRLVRSLSNEVMTAGQHTVLFDGSRLSSGIYFVTLKQHQQHLTTKIALLK